MTVNVIVQAPPWAVATQPTSAQPSLPAGSATLPAGSASTATTPGTSQAPASGLPLPPLPAVATTGAGATGTSAVATVQQPPAGGPSEPTAPPLPTTAPGPTGAPATTPSGSTPSAAPTSLPAATAPPPPLPSADIGAGLSSTATFPASTGQQGSGVLAAGLGRAAARGWSSGASGSGITDGTFAAWRGSQVGITATWADREAETQKAADVADYAGWQGDLDIAVAGTVIGSDEDYAKAAAGAYDARWTAAADNIQRARGNSPGVTYVRAWHEFNGDWYWQVIPGNVEDYKKAFRRYAGILRERCPRCVIVWSPNDGSSNGSAPIADAYPGDDVVDLIGVDSYNANGNPVVVDDATWDTYLHQTEADGSPWGIETWRKFAEQHGKPLGFPEWGLNHKAGGGDNPEYIKRMNAWMAEHASRPGDPDLAGKVVYDVYFDVNHGGDPGFKIKDGPNPRSGAAYQSLRWGTQALARTPGEQTGASTVPAVPTSPVQTQTPARTGGPLPTAPGVTLGPETLPDIPYANGSPSQQLDLYLPGRTGTAIPLVVFIHGGAFSGGDKREVLGARELTSRGIAVASINYRLSGEAPFPAGAQDVKAAVRWLRAHSAEYGLDPNRFAAWGPSSGGYLASMLGVTDTQQPNGLDDPALGNAGTSSAVQAVASLYGPSDFRTMNAQAVQNPCGGTPQDHDADGSPESAWLRGPVQTTALATAADLTAWVPTAKRLPPFLFIHGTADCLVPYDQSEELAEAIAQAGGKTGVILVQGAGHGGASIDQDKLPDVVAFLVQTFGGSGQAQPTAAATTSTPTVQPTRTPPPTKGSGS